MIFFREWVTPLLGKYFLMRWPKAGCDSCLSDSKIISWKTALKRVWGDLSPTSQGLLISRLVCPACLGNQAAVGPLAGPDKKALGGLPDQHAQPVKIGAIQIFTQ